MNLLVPQAAARRILAFGLLLSMACLGAPATAPARPEDRRAWSRHDGWEVSAFEVVGVPEDLAGEAVPGLQYAGRWKLLRGKVRPPFGATTLAADVRRLRLFLARHGYPASRITVALTPDDSARRLAVRFDVKPGPPVLVGALELNGWPAGVPRPDGSEEGLIGPGDRFADDAVGEADEYLHTLLLEAGFARAAVSSSVRPRSDGRVVVVFTIDPGDFYRITEVQVVGCSEDLLPVARRVLDIEPVVDYNKTLLENGSLDLRTSQLFRQVELTAAESAPGELELTAKVADARMRSLEASVGTWSDNPWMVRASWTHRNIFKRGRGLRLQGTLATHETFLGAEVFKLGFLSPRAITTLGLAYRMEDEEAYRSEEYGARILQSFRPRGRGFWNFGVGLSRVFVNSRSTDIDEVPDSQDWLLETWIDRKWDWTDDMIYPTRGGYAKVTMVYAPPAPYLGASYSQISAEGAAYLPLGGRFVGAGRLRLGTSRPLGDNPDLLANRRFYAGGYNSMRGYERRRLGPRDADDNPRGGQTIALAGLELRMRGLALFDLAIFVDTGQVWRVDSDFRFASVDAAWGADLDVRTPIGPLRIGYAWNLTEVPVSDPSGLWHFGIGYPW